MSSVMQRILIPAVPYVLTAIGLHLWSVQAFAVMDPPEELIFLMDDVFQGFYVIGTIAAAVVSYGLLAARFNIGFRYLILLIGLWIGIGVATIVPDVLIEGGYFGYGPDYPTGPLVALGTVIGAAIGIWITSSLLLRMLDGKQRVETP